MSEVLQVVGSALFMCTFLPAPCSAWCPDGVPIPDGVNVITIRYHNALASRLLHPDGTAWTNSELVAALERTIARHNESAGVDGPWLLLDRWNRSSCTWQDPICDGTVPVRSNCLGELPANTWLIMPGWCDATSAPMPLIVMQSSTWYHSAEPLHWNHFETGPGVGFEPALLHEIGHGVGLWHPNECVGWSTICPTYALGCSTMVAAENAETEDLWSEDDRNGLRDLYGSSPIEPTRVFEYRTSFAEITTQSADFTGYIAASGNSGSSGTLTIAGYSRLGNMIRTYSWDWQSMTFFMYSPPHIFQTGGTVGAAQSSSSRFIAAHTARFSSDYRRWSRRLAVSSRPLASGGWTTVRQDPSEFTAADTYVRGVQSAFDPRSGRVLHAFRDNDGRVTVQSMDLSTTSNSITLTNRSLTTPAVACTTSTALRNCILVFTEAEAPANRLQWVEFGWSQSGSSATMNAGSIVTEPYIVTGSPTLSAFQDPPAGSHRFFLSWVRSVGPPSGNFSEILSLRKTLGSAAFGTLTIVGSVAGQFPYPATGTTNGWIEVFATSNARN